MQYSSKDFVITQLQPKTVPTERLLHSNVLDSGLARAFSAQRRHRVGVVDLPSKTISMTLGELEPGQGTNRHRHTYETMLYIVEGEGYSVIEGQRVDWKKGDAVYVPVWAWHRHVNLSQVNKALYVACENAPLLQNLGSLALREESQGEEAQ